jgi:hypothetical protein
MNAGVRTGSRAALIAAVLTTMGVGTGVADAASNRGGDRQPQLPTIAVPHRSARISPFLGFGTRGPFLGRSLQAVLSTAGNRRPEHPKRYRQPSHQLKVDPVDDRGASGNTGSTDYMLYRGGPVQTSPRTYVVFWGDWSTTTDSLNVQGQLYWFLASIGGSSFNNKVAAYAQGCNLNSYTCPSTARYIQNKSNQLKNFWYDNSYVPARPTQADVAAEATRTAQHFADYDVNTQFVIALPRGHDDASFPATCGYHAWALYGNYTIQYTSLSYTPDAGSSGCWNNTFGSILDGVTIVESHEYAETETDPWVGAGNGNEGWDDSTRQYGEIGDKCAASGQAYNLRMTFYAGSSTFTFPVTTVWSDYNRLYYNHGCI